MLIIPLNLDSVLLLLHNSKLAYLNVACRTGVIFAYLREHGRKRGEREARVACVGRFAKNPACRHTTVQALPPPDTP